MEHIQLEKQNKEYGFLESQSELFKLITYKLQSKEKICVAISGKSGSGKTTYLDLLEKNLQQEGCKIFKFNLDNYYKDEEDLIDKNWEKENALKIDQAKADIKTLLEGNNIQMPLYNFKLNKQDGEKRIQMKDKIIVVEGMYALLLNPDILVYINSNKSKSRRAKRDLERKGRTIYDTEQLYEKVVDPEYQKNIKEKYLDNYKIIPDIYVNNNVDLDI